ncbi:MAG: DNA methylase [Oscillospiraceae bacterium]|nr:DNA methylase [Oscillospiraceae bacterium]
MERQYLAIDLKSFYASVECVERGLDPLNTNLVVADESRTDKTICLAVSPSLKAHGIPGRPRLFEVKQAVVRINARRLGAAPAQRFTGSSVFADELRANPGLKLDLIIATPRMARYMDCSAGVYQTYLNYVAPEDIHVYSIDEVFIDVTPYLRTYQCTARELAGRMIRDVLRRTGVTATAGIGTNLYLCKVAMDIVAKKLPADADGVRIAELDERSYREQLWEHRPLTDFWRIGHGISRRLEANGLFTMGDIARCSLGKDHERRNEALLYKLFGVNAELLIDHAWGCESCTMADIKAYRPQSSSLSVGQVLHRPYNWEETRLIVREMADSLVLDLVEKGLATDQLVLSVGYDVENLKTPEARSGFGGPTARDWYGRTMPQSVNGSVNLGRHSASTKALTQAAVALFEQIADPHLTVRRLCIAANHVRSETELAQVPAQLSLFSDPETEAAREAEAEKERRQQEAILAIRKKYGKNAIVKAMNLQEAGTAIDRNAQVGGHKA